MIEAILGFTLGILSATVSESVGHRIFGHPSRAQLEVYFRYPRFFAPFLRAYYHHFVIHHERTFRDDVLTQFKDADEKLELDGWIAEEFPEDFAELIWTERYNLTLKGIKGILPFAIPFLTGPLLIWLAFGKVAFVASLFSAFIPVLLSKYLHPFIHQPQDLRSAPKLVREIARTRYMKWVFMNHYLHHKHPDWNFNLLPGGDHIVRAHRSATDLEKQEFMKLWQRFEGSWQAQG